jgi:hypothetical protein
MIPNHYLVILAFMLVFIVASVMVVDALTYFFVLFVRAATSSLRSQFIGDSRD